MRQVVVLGGGTASSYCDMVSLPSGSLGVVQCSIWMIWVYEKLSILDRRGENNPKNFYQNCVGTCKMLYNASKGQICAIQCVFHTHHYVFL